MKADLETWIEEVQEEISGLEEEVKEKKDAQDTILNDDNAVKTVEDQEGRMEAVRAMPMMRRTLAVRIIVAARDSGCPVRSVPCFT